MVDREELSNTIAYCGLICGVCQTTEKGCHGCRNGGGQGECYQRKCCLRKSIEGCWQCEAFPCEQGFFADEAWKGLCRAFIQCIKDDGIDEFVSLVLSRLGSKIEYGDFRFKSESEIIALLRGTS